MAQLIPDRLPTGSSQGEKRLFAVLQRLPDEFLVYYEPVIANRYPDFVVIAPSLGVIVIEVKGWWPKDVLGGDSHTIQIRDRGTDRNDKHPVRQARDYQNNLQDECRKSPLARSLLMHASGKHEGRFVFPFCHFAVLSNITAEQLRSHPAGDLTTLFPKERTLTRDELLQWEGLSGEAVLGRIRQFFDPYWEIEPLSERQVELLRSIVHPEIRLEARHDPNQLVVLDMRQERHARAIGDGHRILYGVAGSGKTVLLTARARLLSEQSPEKEILVLCYNVALAARLRGLLCTCHNVQVQHFDGWAKRNKVPRRWGQNDGPPEPNQELGARLREHLKQGNGDSRRFGAVLVDEAQDFDSTWFECVLEAMQDPLEGDLLIVGDRHQGIYGPKAVTWSSIGIKAVGRTTHTNLDLDRNYRNSREILELAALFATDRAQLSGDQFGVVTVDPEKSLRATGVMPRLLPAASRRAECDKVRSTVEELLDPTPRRNISGREPLSPSDVGILYPGTPRDEPGLIVDFVRELAEVAPVVRLHEGDRDRVDDFGVKVQSIHGSKGLQYRAVIVLWADLLPWKSRASDPLEAEKLMYVALTRAEDYLFVSCSGPSEFIDRMVQSGKIL